MIAFIIEHKRYWICGYFYVTGFFSMSLSSIMSPVSEIGLLYKVIFMIMGGFCVLAGYDVHKMIDKESIQHIREELEQAEKDAKHQIKMIKGHIKIYEEHEKELIKRQKERESEAQRQRIETQERRERQRQEWATHAIERRKGYVYILKADNGAYKIGRTNNPKSRRQTFGVELPFDVEYEVVIKTDDMYQLERDLHREYRHKHIRAEWFALSVEDIIAIQRRPASADSAEGEG